MRSTRLRQIFGECVITSACWTFSSTFTRLYCFNGDDGNYLDLGYLDCSTTPPPQTQPLHHLRHQRWRPLLSSLPVNGNDQPPPMNDGDQLSLTSAAPVSEHVSVNGYYWHSELTFGSPSHCYGSWPRQHGFTISACRWALPSATLTTMTAHNLNISAFLGDDE